MFINAQKALNGFSSCNNVSFSCVLSSLQHLVRLEMLSTAHINIKDCQYVAKAEAEEGKECKINTIT